MCLAQGHNAVKPVRLEPAGPRSRVKYSATKPLRSHDKIVSDRQIYKIIISLIPKMYTEKLSVIRAVTRDFQQCGSLTSVDSMSLCSLLLSLETLHDVQSVA